MTDPPADAKMDRSPVRQEEAELLHVSPKTVSRWGLEGRLPYVTTLGGHRRYPKAPIHEVVERMAREGSDSLAS